MSILVLKPLFNGSMTATFSILLMRNIGRISRDRDNDFLNYLDNIRLSPIARDEDNAPLLFILKYSISTSAIYSIFSKKFKVYVKYVI